MDKFSNYNLYSMNAGNEQQFVKDKVDEHVEKLSAIKDKEEVLNYLNSNFSITSNAKFVEFEDCPKALYIKIDEDKNIEILVLEIKKGYGWESLKSSVNND